MKTKNTIIGFLLLIPVAFLSSCCDEHNCIEGNHNVVVETRNLDHFNRIESEGSFNIQVVQGAVYKVTIKAESNLIDYIRTRVQGSTLVIDTRNNRCLDNNYAIQITVHTPVLHSAAIEGSGNLYCDFFETPEIYLDIIGSGNMYMDVLTDYINASIVGSGNIDLTGSSIEAEFSISGSGSIFSYDLPVETCFINISGSGNMFVNVSELLDVKISGSGNVYYIGHPEINSVITGSGSVIHGK